MSTDTPNFTVNFDTDVTTEQLPTGSDRLDVPRPRIRWGAIVWGTIVTVVMVAVLVILVSPDRRDAFATWLETLGTGGFVMIGILLAGFIILLLAVLAMVRRAQRTH